MRNFILFVMLLATCFVFSACGAGDVGGPGYQSSSAVEENSEVSSVAPVSDYDDSLSGLIQCMSDSGYISGDSTAMSAGLIGAKEGYKYQFVYEKANVTVELYEFDVENLSDTARSVHDQVLQSGSFTIQKIKVPASLSTTRKFLMIYECSSENEANQQRKTDVENLLKEWKS